MNKQEKKCPEGKILNIKSGRCVNIDGTIGKKILAMDKQSSPKEPSPKKSSPKKRDLKKSIIRHLAVIRDFEKMNNNIYKAKAYTVVLAQTHPLASRLVRYV